MNAWIQTATFGYSYMWANGARLTDTQGHYELTNLPEGATLQVQVYKDGYVRPCASPQLLIDRNLTVDAQLVSLPHASASRDSVPPSAPGFRMVSGVLYEVTMEGRRPAPRAFVDYEPTDDFPGATNYTDAQGRFLLCGIPEDRSASIGASLGSGRYAYVSVPPGGDATIEIEIK